MNIVILGLVTLVFFLCPILTFIIGYKLGKNSKPKDLTEAEKEKERIRLQTEGINNVFNYDINTAMAYKRGE